MKKLIECSLSLILLLALFGSLLIPAKADSGAIDLRLGNEETTSWKMTNIYPGQKGTETVTLHNAGYADGVVTVWITDIQETDYAGDGAWLAHYVVFDVSSDRLSTNLNLPLTIHEFPQDASGTPNYLRINSFKTGETITLIWHWHFLAEAGNETQGDSFSFTINYKLEGNPPPPGDDDWEEPAASVIPPTPEPPEPTPPEEPEPVPLEPPVPPEPIPPVPPTSEPTPPEELTPVPTVPPVTPTPVVPAEEIDLPLIQWIIAGLLVIAGITYFLIKRGRAKKG